MASERYPQDTNSETANPGCLGVSKSRIRNSLSRRSKFGQFYDFVSTLWKLEDDSDTETWHPEEGKKRSDDIDRYLNAESSRMKHHTKVLLLGGLEEVDIFWKQTRLLSEPLSPQERDALRVEVRKSVVRVAEGFINLLDHESQEMMNAEKSVGAAAQVKRAVEEVLSKEGEDFGLHVAALYRDSAFHDRLHEMGMSWAEIEHEALELNRPCPVTCPCGCGISSITRKLGRIFSPDYEPTETDYLQFDKRIHGMYVREAQARTVTGTHTLCFLDIKNKRGERKKWTHLFEDMGCAVFIVDMETYNHYFNDDQEDNRLREMMVLFESVANSRWFRETPLLLVMANAAAFKSKIATEPLGKIFPGYAGNTADEAVEYVVGRFGDLARRDRVYTCVADGLDRASVEKVIDRTQGALFGDGSVCSENTEKVG